MNSSANQSIYKLLTVDSARQAREALQKRYDYCYHFTLREHLASIARSGIDPARVSPDSVVSNPYEPGEVIRYCVAAARVSGNGPSGLDVAYSTALTRSASDIVAQPDRVVLLRVRSATLLERAFGLDHSYDPVTKSIDNLRLAEGQILSAEQFVDLVDASGVISCYEVIPANLVDFCDMCTPDRSKLSEGTFTPLV